MQQQIHIMHKDVAQIFPLTTHLISKACMIFSREWNQWEHLLMAVEGGGGKRM